MGAAISKPSFSHLWVFLVVGFGTPLFIGLLCWAVGRTVGHFHTGAVLGGMFIVFWQIGATISWIWNLSQDASAEFDKEFTEYPSVVRAISSGIDLAGSILSFVFKLPVLLLISLLAGPEMAFCMYIVWVILSDQK